MSTDQCLWCRYSYDGELKGVIGIHVDDFLIGLAGGILCEKWMSEIKSSYRWGSWKVSESEFAGIRVRQHRDFSITVDLEDYNNKFITEAPITRESRQRQESLTAQELSMSRGVLGTASWRAQQLSPQFAADVSSLLSATADPVAQDLLDANKLVRDMRRSSAQSLHFHSFNETPWQQLVFASWADASDRSDGSRTGGYVITLATEELFGHGQEDDVSVMSGDPSNFRGKLLDQTMVRLKLLHLLTNPSGWSVWPGLRCTVLRCGAGIWTKQSDKWAVCSSQILEVFLMP